MTEPATDEQIANAEPETVWEASLIARIEAEKARADRLSKIADQWETAAAEAFERGRLEGQKNSYQRIAELEARLAAKNVGDGVEFAGCSNCKAKGERIAELEAENGALREVCEPGEGVFKGTAELAVELPVAAEGREDIAPEHARVRDYLQKRLQ